MNVRQLLKILESADPDSEVMVEDSGHVTEATAGEVTLNQSEFENQIPWNRVFLISMRGKMKLSLPVRDRGGFGTRPLIQKGAVYREETS